MSVAILGKKIGMTQVYDAAGVLHAVSVVEAGPCPVLQVKSSSSDGYDSLQIGFGEVKARRAKKPQLGEAAKAGTGPKQIVREIRLDTPSEEAKVGEEITVEVFEGVGFVDVTGTTKGKGFAGGMKRHGFHGLGASHGVERKHRSPGSISSHASNAGTGKPKKGKRMAGHMGSVRCTSRNHRLIGIDKEHNLLLIKGPVPGANGGFVYVRLSKTARESRR